MIEAEGSVRIRCECGIEYEISASEISWVHKERETKSSFEGESTGEIYQCCTECGREMTAAFYVSEYPIGSCSGSMVQSCRCTVISEPSYVDNFEPEVSGLEEVENSQVIWLPDRILAMILRHIILNKNEIISPIEQSSFPKS